MEKEKVKKALVSVLLALLVSCALSITGEVPGKAKDFYGLLRVEMVGEAPLSVFAGLALAYFFYRRRTGREEVAGGKDRIVGKEEKEEHGKIEEARVVGKEEKEKIEEARIEGKEEQGKIEEARIEGKEEKGKIGEARKAGKAVKRGYGSFVAFLFALFTCLGLSFSKNGSLSFWFFSLPQFFLFVLTFAGYFILYRELLLFAYAWLDQRTNGFAISRGESGKKEERRAFWSGFFFLLLCWLPFLIVFWPGSLTRDAYRSLNMGFGIWPLNGHQPWVISMFFSGLVALGRHVNDNVGIFLTVLVLCLIQALSYAQVGRFFVRWGLPSWARKAALAFFGILPIFASYSQALIKDGMNAALYTLMVGHVLDYCFLVSQGSREGKGEKEKQEEGREVRSVEIREERKEVGRDKGFEEERKEIEKVEGIGVGRVEGVEGRREEIGRGERIKKLLLIVFFGVLCTYARRNGIYPVMVTIVLLPFLLPKGERKASPILFVLVAAGYLLHSVLGQAVGVEAASPRVYFSIPFQQTARYLRDYPEDVTEEELAVIDRLVDVQALPEIYTPESSDPVKNSFRGGIGMDAVFDYLKVWWQMFLRHPMVYFEATLHNSYGYYYPFTHMTVNKPFYLTMAGGVYDTGYFHFFYLFPKAVRDVLYRYCFTWQNIPLLAGLVNTGFYTWLYLFLMGFIGYRKRYRLWAAFGGFVILLAIFTASPINGCVRYFLPLISSAPLLCAWTFGGEGKRRAMKI